MSKTTKKFEVEYRSFVTKEKLEHLRDFLNNNGKDLGKDNKDVYFFIFPNKMLKVVHNVSQNNAQIVLKSNALGNGHSIEQEIPLEINLISDMVDLFKSLGFTKIVHSYQERHNYLYKETEISLKHSDNWGHHVELEIVLDEDDDPKDAEEKIKNIAKELDLKLLTDKETENHAAKVIKEKAIK